MPKGQLTKGRLGGVSIAQRKNRPGENGNPDQDARGEDSQPARLAASLRFTTAASEAHCAVASQRSCPHRPIRYGHRRYREDADRSPFQTAAQEFAKLESGWMAATTPNPARARGTARSCRRSSLRQTLLRPANISNSTQPNDQTSVRLSRTLPTRLFRAHIAGVPRIIPSPITVAVNVCDPDSSSLRRAFPDLGQPEVQHFDRTVAGDLDIRRLEVAMDNALLVRRFERLGDLARDRPYLVGGRSMRSDRRVSARRPAPAPVPGAVRFLQP